MRFLAGLVIGLTATAAAQSFKTADGDYTVYGPGTASCATWKADRTNDHLRQLDVAWVEGFTTAAGQYGRWQLTRTDSAALIELIDGRCRTETTLTIERATIDVVRHLALQ